jgi:hypothetical protein
MNRARDLTSNKQRVQFDLLPNRVDEIDQLMLEAGIDTRKELINNAISLFEWAVLEVRSGREIASLDKAAKSYEILRMPALIQAAKNAKITKTFVSTIIEKQADAVSKTEKAPNEGFVAAGF